MVIDDTAAIGFGHPNRKLYAYMLKRGEYFVTKSLVVGIVDSHKPMPDNGKILVWYNPGTPQVRKDYLDPNTEILARDADQVRKWLRRKRKLGGS